MSTKNNFTRDDVKEKARYKLWVKYLPQFVSAKLPQIKVYYSYDKPGDPEFGYRKLLSMLYQRIHKIKLAILYDNHSNKEIKRFDNEQK
ncbi:MAG: hypothetical protein U0V72_00195 [Cytophagales bacterium]